MPGRIRLPWMKIHEFLLEVGAERNPENFCLQTLNKINSLIPFDSAVLLMLDKDGNICKDVLVEIEPQWYQAYLDYYSKLDGDFYSFQTQRSGVVIGWDSFKETEFIVDFLRLQQINYTATLQFFDSASRITCAMILNRFSRKVGFQDSERKILNLIMTHLANLHTNLYVSRTECQNQKPNFELPNLPNRLQELIFREFRSLTKREVEVAALLCQGANTQKISADLLINTRTVYKHIENIFEKLEVSNRQELVSKILITK